VLNEKFYARDTVSVAKDLLGKIMVHETSQGITSGIIIETEAYLENDPACHAYRGMTKRNATMFGPPGKAYVYLIYGIHYCFNAVTKEEGTGEAVLVRSIYPLEGIELMRERRGGKCHNARLSCGPGNLCKSMGINAQHDTISLENSPLQIKFDNIKVSSEDIGVSKRIGLNKGNDLYLRFYLKGYEKFVSGR